MYNRFLKANKQQHQLFNYLRRDADTYLIKKGLINKRKSSNIKENFYI